MDGIKLECVEVTASLPHEIKSGIVVVPGKPSNDIPIGTLNSIWKQARVAGDK